MRLIPPFNEIGYPLFRSINGSFVRVTTRPRLFAASFSSPALDVIRARVQIAPGSVLAPRSLGSSVHPPTMNKSPGARGRLLAEIRINPLFCPPTVELYAKRPSDQGWALVVLGLSVPPARMLQRWCHHCLPCGTGASTRVALPFTRHTSWISHGCFYKLIQAEGL